MALRSADDSDWMALIGTQPPAEWFGLVEARDWLIEGLGAIIRDGDDWFLVFQRCPVIVKVKSAHAAAKRLIAMAEARGITVKVCADPAIDGAETWIARLGFRRTDQVKQTMRGEVAVWTR